MRPFDRTYRKRRKTTPPFEAAGPEPRSGLPQWQDTGNPSDSPDEYEGASAALPSAAGALSYSLRLYLRDVASVAMLNREQEFRLAASIREGEAEIRGTVLSSLVALQWVLRLVKKFAAGQILIDDIIEPPASELKSGDNKQQRTELLRNLTYLKTMAQAHQRGLSQCARASSSEERKKFERRCLRQRAKITSVLAGLGLSRAQLQGIIDHHERIYDELDFTDRKSIGNRKQPSVPELEDEGNAGVRNSPARHQYSRTEPAFGTARNSRADAGLVLTSIVTNTHREQIVGLAAKSRLPAIYHTAEWVEAGGLLTYGASFPDLFRRSATYVDKILKAAKPGNL